MKTITLDGRIGSDAVIRTTKNGRPYVNFSVANNYFNHGVEKTEWFDISSFDPYIIENKVKYLTKGTYVIIGGGISTEVKVGEGGKIWLNHYVTATSIDTPSLGKKSTEASSQDSAPQLSTYTAKTQTVKSEPNTADNQYVSAKNDSIIAESAKDDLPF